MAAILGKRKDGWYLMTPANALLRTWWQSFEGTDNVCLSCQFLSHENIMDIPSTERQPGVSGKWLAERQLPVSWLDRICEHLVHENYSKKSIVGFLNQREELESGKHQRYSHETDSLKSVVPNTPLPQIDTSMDSPLFKPPNPWALHRRFDYCGGVGCPRKDMAKKSCSIATRMA